MLFKPYGGYVPLSVRLVEDILKDQQWQKTYKEGLDFIQGYTSVPAQQFNNKQNANKAILVYFIGGVTYGEIAGLRVLSEFYNREIIIATTQIINSKKFIHQCSLSNNIPLYTI